MVAWELTLLPTLDYWESWLTVIKQNPHVLNSLVLRTTSSTVQQSRNPPPLRPVQHRHLREDAP